MPKQKYILLLALLFIGYNAVVTAKVYKKRYSVGGSKSIVIKAQHANNFVWQTLKGLPNQPVSFETKADTSIIVRDNDSLVYTIKPVNLSCVGNTDTLIFVSRAQSVTDPSVGWTVTTQTACFPDGTAQAPNTDNLYLNIKNIAPNTTIYLTYNIDNGTAIGPIIIDPDNLYISIDLTTLTVGYHTVNITNFRVGLENYDFGKTINLTIKPQIVITDIE